MRTLLTTMCILGVRLMIWIGPAIIVVVQWKLLAVLVVVVVHRRIGGAMNITFRKVLGSVGLEPTTTVWAALIVLRKPRIFEWTITESVLG